MDQQEATDFVISEIGKLHSKNDIIQKLCENTGMNWGQAEKFVLQVAMENRGAIAQKQSPFIVITGVIIILGGLSLSLITIYETLQGTIIIFLRLPIPYLGNIVFFIIGLSMIAGGLRGTWDTIVRVWNS